MLMGELSKITVKPYIYTHVKAGVKYRFTENNANTDKILYPLYYVVIHKRQNTKMKSFYSDHYEKLEDVQLKSPGLIDFETKIIELAIQYESNKGSGNFQMKGFPDRFNKYVRSSSQVIERYLKHKIWLGTNRASQIEEYQNQYFNYFFFINYRDPKLRFRHLYNLFQKVYTDFNQFLKAEDIETIEALELFQQVFNEGKGYQFTTIIEWLNNTAINDFRNQLINKFKIDAMKADIYIERCENAIQSELEMIN